MLCTSILQLIIYGYILLSQHYMTHTLQNQVLTLTEYIQSYTHFIRFFWDLPSCNTLHFLTFLQKDTTANSVTITSSGSSWIYPPKVPSKYTLHWVPLGLTLLEYIQKYTHFIGFFWDLPSENTYIPSKRHNSKQCHHNFIGFFLDLPSESTFKIHTSLGSSGIYPPGIHSKIHTLHWVLLGFTLPKYLHSFKNTRLSG